MGLSELVTLVAGILVFVLAVVALGKADLAADEARKSKREAAAAVSAFNYVTKTVAAEAGKGRLALTMLTEDHVDPTFPPTWRKPVLRRLDAVESQLARVTRDLKPTPEPPKAPEIPKLPPTIVDRLAAAEAALQKKGRR